MDLVTAIEQRKSVRNYDKRALSEKDAQSVTDFINESDSPFGRKISVKLINNDSNPDFKPSTYGVIHGAQNYLLLGYADDTMSQLAAGFAMEHIVIKVQSIGLSTCWLGGTFKGSRFGDIAKFPETTPLKIVVPLGYAADRRHFFENISRKLSHSDKRLAPDKLFFKTKTLAPLAQDDRFYRPLMLMRLAPSSLNSQPWRAIINNDNVDFYSTSTDRFGTLNIGIGLAHFSIGCQTLGIDGTFFENQTPEPLHKAKYIISFKCL